MTAANAIIGLLPDKEKEPAQVNNESEFPSESMQVAGLEPARSCLREILSLLCLPIPPYLQKRKMGGGGFEPPKQFAADLQSVPFGHSGIHPSVSYHSDIEKFYHSSP